MWKISPTYISLNGSWLQSTKYGCSFIKNNKIELSVHREMVWKVPRMLSGKEARLEKESKGFTCEVGIFSIIRILLYVIYIIKMIFKNKCVKGKFMLNVLFSNSIPSSKVREELNSQWDNTVSWHSQPGERREVILAVFSDSFVRSCVFPADVLLMTHGPHLIPQALSVPYWDFPSLPDAAFPYSTKLPSCTTASLWPLLLLLTGHWWEVSFHFCQSSC